MKYILILALLSFTIACSSEDQKLTKTEVLENYSGEANLGDVYIVDTIGENTVKDTLPIITKTGKRIDS